VMKASETYHLNYRAAFKYDAKPRLPLITIPALAIAGENDPLFEITGELAQLIPGGRFAGMPRFDAPTFAAERKAKITSFFAQTVAV